MATLDELARLRPRLAHVTFPGAADSIRRMGLRSVTTLVSDAELPGHLGTMLIESYRSELRRVTLPDGTTVVLRDQLRRRRDVGAALDGITEGEWLRIINERVFLFPAGHKRVEELVMAYTSRGHVQEVITFDTRRLLRDREDAIEVATVNSGTFPRVSGPCRGPATFVRLAELPRKRLAAVQEVTIRGVLPVPDGAILTVTPHRAR